MDQTTIFKTWVRRQVLNYLSENSSTIVPLRPIIEKADGMVTLKYRAKSASPLKPFNKNSFLIKIEPGQTQSKVTRLSYGRLGSQADAGTHRGWYLHRDTISNEELQANWLQEPGTVTIKLAKSFIKTKTAPKTQPQEPAPVRKAPPRRAPEPALNEAKNSGYVLSFKNRADFKTIQIADRAGLLSQYQPELDARNMQVFFAIPNRMSASANARTFAKRLFADLTDLELQFMRPYSYKDLTARSLDAAEAQPEIIPGE